MVGRAVGPLVYDYYEDGHWQEGFELRGGFGGDVPIIHGQDRGSWWAGRESNPDL